jgi:hypothetical protein
MVSAAVRPPLGPDEAEEGRTALKTYVLQAHGEMARQPLAALAEVGAKVGFEARPCRDPELLTLAQGDLTAWLDTSDRAYFRLHTTANVKEADRLHEALVHATPLLEPTYLLPATLEALAARVEGKMVLFSLRHDRRELRGDEESRGDEVDLVTLRFWAPSAAETLDRLRKSEVLPGATSVYSVRVRVGPPEAFALTEVFHNGKFTSSGNSFEQLERVLRVVLSDHAATAAALESSSLGPVRVWVPVPWPGGDPAYAIGRLFGGGEPFRLWGLPEHVDGSTYQVRAVDLGVAKPVLFEVGPEGLGVELPPGTPVSVAQRVVAALQYHVNADVRCDAFAAEPLLARAKTPAPRPLPPLTERSPLDRVVRSVLSEACAEWLRGGAFVAAPPIARAIAAQSHVTPAFVDLVRAAMTEAAAFEWHEWLRPVIGPDRSTLWEWRVEPPITTTPRARELMRLNRHAQRMLTRLTGGVAEPWMQLSLFGAEALVPPVELRTPG